jgi:hypothetical protein
MRGYAVSPYDQIPAVEATSDRWPRIIAPVITAAIVLALGLVLVTFTCSVASEAPTAATPTVDVRG